MARYTFVDHWSIKAPIEQVFQYIADPATYPAWWQVYPQVEILQVNAGAPLTHALDRQVGAGLHAPT